MSSTLNPTLATIATVRGSIQTALKVDLPANLIVNGIAPYLSSVNLWSNQIPTMLEGAGPSTSANLVFAIRKDLFLPPQFTQSILGIALAELPAPFQEFVAFTHKLIEAQKNDKEKSTPKVPFSFPVVAIALIAPKSFQIAKRGSRIFKSKPLVEDEDMESTPNTVSESTVETGQNPIDESVCPSLV